jgi:hypothetical protein
MIKWTNEEIELLKKIYSKETLEIKKTFPNRTYNAIKQKASKLGLKRKFWEKKLINFQPSPQTSYILGVMVGDGYTWRRSIELHVKNKNFADMFAENCTKLGLHVWKGIDSHNLNIVKAYSASLAYRIKDITSNTEKFYNFVKDYPVDFIRGFFDSEGTAIKGYHDGYLYYCCTMCNTKKELLDLVKILAEKIGFKSSIRISRKGNQKLKTLYQLTILGGSKEAIRFIEMIKPVAKNWNRR